MAKIIFCGQCGFQFSVDRYSCPRCGAPFPDDPEIGIPTAIFDTPDNIPTSPLSGYGDSSSNNLSFGTDPGLTNNVSQYPQQITPLILHPGPLDSSSDNLSFGTDPGLTNNVSQYPQETAPLILRPQYSGFSDFSSGNLAIGTYTESCQYPSKTTYSSVQSAATRVVYCTNCGYNFPIETKYCRHCGTRNTPTSELSYNTSSISGSYPSQAGPGPVGPVSGSYGSRSQNMSSIYRTNYKVKLRRERRKRILLSILYTPILFIIYVFGSSWADLRLRGSAALTVWLATWLVSLITFALLIRALIVIIDDMNGDDLGEGGKTTLLALFLSPVMLFVAPRWMYPLMASQTSGIAKRALDLAPGGVSYGITWFVSMMNQPVTIALITAITFIGTLLSILQLLKRKDKGEDS